jgi:cyclase
MGTVAHQFSEVGDGCHAYVQGNGGWGWSNAGLIVGDGTSLLVDTLYGLDVTAVMLEAMRPITTAAPIDTVVNTHANGDHCYGNEQMGRATIIASAATAEEMPAVPPSLMAGLNAAPGEMGDLFRSFFGEFEFEGIELRLPDQTFTGRLTVDVGGRSVELIEVGPAHTAGDTIAVVADAGVIYTGDILFIGGTPVVWAGPLSNWIAACDLMLASNCDTIVPGHGPVTDKAGVRAVRDYLTFIDTEATARHAAGIDAFDAARELAAVLGSDARFGGLGEFGRITVNVDAVYRELDPTYHTPDIIEQFRRMAAIEHG